MVVVKQSVDAPCKASSTRDFSLVLRLSLNFKFIHNLLRPLAMQ